MNRQLINRREAIKRALTSCLGAAAGASLFSACGPGVPSPPPACEPSSDDAEVGWGPSVLAPVFYGYADYNPSVGAPANIRVYYPSADGSPPCAPFLAGPGRFPLVLLLHGQCPSESFHYTKWFQLPAVLARSGFIVAIPDLGLVEDPRDPGNTNYALINSVITWMRSVWSHHAFVMPPPTLGIVGHSYGALLGGQLALTIPATAYASLGGGWNEWSPFASAPLNMLNMPKLLIWGTGSSVDLVELEAVLSEGVWNALPSPKHRLVFAGGEHWDYVPSSATSCGKGAGPCNLVHGLTADLIAMFLGKYMPPEMATWSPATTIASNLVPPILPLTFQQQFFVGGHLGGLKNFGTAPRCSAKLTWVTPGDSNMRTLP